MAAKIPFVSRLPFLVVAVALGVTTICVAVVRLTERLPINPWESAIAMEAMRLNAGLPLYETAHATHMYGPLLTVMLAGIFRITGLNLLAARIVFSVLAFGLAIFVSAILCRGDWRKYGWLALLLLLGINLRTNLIFLSAQPDCVATLLATVGLYCWIKQRNKAISIALFVCAMLFKQTTAAFALIPPVYVLIWERPLSFRALTKSLIPMMSIFLALAAMFFFWPQMFAAVVAVPAAIKIYPERVLKLTLYVLATFPIFLVALLSIVRTKAISAKERWVFSALIVLIPASIWIISKGGGSYNSLLFAYLAMAALFIVRLEAISDWLGSLSIQRSIWAASAITLAILLSFFVQFDRVISLLNVRCGDDSYETVVNLAGRRSADKVISPQDPTIAYRARGYFGRSLFFELDAHAKNGIWPNELPDSIQQELAQADYVIEVKGYVPTPVFERGLLQNRFHPMTLLSLPDSAYTFWTRKGD